MRTTSGVATELAGALDLDEDAAYRRDVRTFLRARFAPSHRSERPPEPAISEASFADLAGARRAQSVLAQAGYAGITWPERYGGGGGGLAQQLAFAEESAAFDLPTAIFGVGLNLAGPTILSHGSEWQRQRFLPPLLRGEEIWCQLFSEPDAGSDLANVRTRAVRDGDDWILNGQKVWSSGAHQADFGIALARTDLAGPKHRGLTFFLLDMRQPGITTRPLRQMTGDAHFAEVFFTDVRVPHTHVVGEVNGGWAVAISTLMNERVVTTGGSFAVNPQQLVNLARQTTIDGRPAIEGEAVRDALADVYVRATVMRALNERSRAGVARGQSLGSSGSVAKLVNGLLLKDAANLALRIEGATAPLEGTDAPLGGIWQRVLLMAPLIRIAGGTDEIQRNIIGERILGLPRDARPDGSQ